MRKLDRDGAKLCGYQARIFEGSVNRYNCSSKVFLRRFFASRFVRFYLDEPEEHIFDYDIDTAYRKLDKEYSSSDYGSTKINENILFWLGYITRYICYTRGITSFYLYKTFGLDIFIDNYYVYHTQNEEWVISRILDSKGLSEDDIKPEIISKNILKGIWKDVIDM